VGRFGQRESVKKRKGEKKIGCSEKKREVLAVRGNRGNPGRGFFNSGKEKQWGRREHIAL